MIKLKCLTHVGKTLLWTTFLLVFIIAQITTVKATAETTIRVEPYASIAPVGESFTVNITLTDVQNLYGVDVKLRWNASILQVVEVDVRLGVESHPDGVLHEDILFAKNETRNDVGRYWLAATSYNKTIGGTPPPSFNGSGNIIRLTFNVTNAGSCELSLETELCAKPPPGDIAPLIEHTTIDGFFGRQIRISVSPMTVNVGENVNISGFVIPAQANVEITILYRREGEADWRTFITLANEQGNYLYIWQPQESGKYEIKATAIIEGIEEISSSIFVAVEAPEQPPQQPTWPYVIIIIIIITAIIATTVMYRKKLKTSRKTGS